MRKRTAMGKVLHGRIGAVRIWMNVLLVEICVCSAVWGQQAKSTAGSAKSVPPAGVEVSAGDRAELESGLSALAGSIKELKGKKDEHVAGLLPDVEVFYRAVNTALVNHEFFDAADVTKAKALLMEGQARADQLRDGQSPWTNATGLVVRGYLSKIDGTVQPYGLVVPATYKGDGPAKFRLDVWLHGRNEKLSEVNFLDERRRSRGSLRRKIRSCFIPTDGIATPSSSLGRST